MKQKKPIKFSELLAQNQAQAQAQKIARKKRKEKTNDKENPINIDDNDNVDKNISRNTDTSKTIIISASPPKSPDKLSRQLSSPPYSPRSSLYSFSSLNESLASSLSSSTVLASPLPTFYVSEFSKALQSIRIKPQLVSFILQDEPDLKYLKDGVWLKDEIIDSYAKLLIKNRDDVAYYPTGEFTNDRNLDDKVFQTLLQRRKGRRNTTVRMQEFDDNVEIILIPIIHKSHFTLACINFNNKTINFYDSLAMYSEIPFRSKLAIVANTLIQLSQKYKQAEKIDWVFRYHQSPRQDNSDDCGVHTLLNVRCILGNHNISDLTIHQGSIIRSYYNILDIPSTRNLFIVELYLQRILLPI